jgi:molecular chaperone GrpE (heat shock protein)
MAQQKASNIQLKFEFIENNYSSVTGRLTIATQSTPINTDQIVCHRVRNAFSAKCQLEWFYNDEKPLISKILMPFAKYSIRIHTPHKIGGFKTTSDTLTFNINDIEFLLNAPPQKRSLRGGKLKEKNGHVYKFDNRIVVDAKKRLYSDDDHADDEEACDDDDDETCEKPIEKRMRISSLADDSHFESLKEKLFLSEDQESHKESEKESDKESDEKENEKENEKESEKENEKESEKENEKAHSEKEDFGDDPFIRAVASFASTYRRKLREQKDAMEQSEKIKLKISDLLNLQQDLKKNYEKLVEEQVHQENGLYAINTTIDKINADLEQIKGNFPLPILSDSPLPHFSTQKHNSQSIDQLLNDHTF